MAKHFVLVVLTVNLIAQASPGSTGTPPKPFHLSVIVESVHAKGPALHAAWNIDQRFSVELGYGYYRTHSGVVDLVVGFPTGNFKPVLFGGYGLFWKGFSSGEKSRTHTLNVGTGIRAPLKWDLFAQMDVCFIKDILQSYSSTDHSFSERFSWNEKIHPQIGIGLGICFGP